MPSTDLAKPHHDAAYQHSYLDQALSDQEKTATSEEIHDILTNGQFFEIMKNFHK